MHGATIKIKDLRTLPIPCSRSIQAAPFPPDALFSESYFQRISPS